MPTIEEVPVPTPEEVEAAVAKLISGPTGRIARVYNESLDTPSFHIFVQGLIYAADRDESQRDPMGKLLQVLFASGMVAMEGILSDRTSSRPN